MNDDRMDRLLREVIGAEGADGAPAGLVDAILLEAQATRQGRILVPPLHPEAWPARPGWRAHPATWRATRIVIVAAVILSLLAATIAVGAAWLRQPRPMYDGVLRPIATIGAPFLSPDVVPLPRGRVFVSGSPMTDGQALAVIVDLASGRSVVVRLGAATAVDLAIGLPDGRVLVLASHLVAGSGRARSLVLAVDPETGLATEIGSLVEPRQAPAAVALDDGSVLIGGGYDLDSDPQGLRSVERLDPLTGRSEIVGELLQARDSPAFTRLPDNSVLVSGPVLVREQAPRPDRTIESFDATTGRAELVATLPRGTSSFDGPTAPPVLLADGRVLIFGSKEAQYCGRHGIDEIDSALLDPVTGAAEPGPRFPHHVSTALRLADGSLLIAGTWVASGPAPGGCVEGNNEQVRDSWIGIVDPLTAAGRLSPDPYGGGGSLAADPTIDIGGAALLEDGRVVLVTQDPLSPEPVAGEVLVLE